MKTLVVIRHAKSSWSDPSLSDFDRPLNDRGLRDAPTMGKRILGKNLIPQLMLSSPANRAITTCRLIAKEISYPESDIETNDRLYHADAADILKVIRQLKDSISVAFIFGHNPGLTEFTDELTDEQIDNVPTCGVAVCKLNVKSWSELTWGKGLLVEFDYPKKSD